MMLLLPPTHPHNLPPIRISCLAGSAMEGIRQPHCDNKKGRKNRPPNLNWLLGEPTKEKEHVQGVSWRQPLRPPRENV